MALRYSYTKTTLSAVSTALTALFASLESEQQSFNRAANANVIIPLSGVAKLEPLEADLDTLSLVHPSRFFVIYVDNQLQSPEVYISARCHALSKSEHVCSEILRIAFPAAQFAAIPSLIRANTLTDMPTEVYLADADFPKEFLTGLLENGNTLALDSAEFEGRFDALEQLEGMVDTVLDLQWVGLGLWRDEIKDLFSRPLVREYVRSIRSVEVASTAPEGRDSAAALLVGAWIADRLGLARGLVYGHDGFECSDGSGRTIRLAFKKSAAAGASKLTEVLFRFDPLQVGSASQDQYIRLRRNGEALETMVDLNVSYRATRPFDDESRQSRVRRYFLIGESMTNYTAAARLALEFARMRRGYVRSS